MDLDLRKPNVRPLAILATGMMTGVGLDAPSSCAAIRCAIDRFEETRFIDSGGEWIVVSTVPLDPPVRGRARLIEMAAAVIQECLDQHPGLPLSEIPMFLCLAEPDRPGRLDGLDESLLDDLGKRLGQQLHGRSRVIANGRVGGVQAVSRAARRIEQGYAVCLVVGVDGFVHAKTLAGYERKRRLLTSTNSNGFIPGEGAAAVLFGPAESHPAAPMICRGIGYGREAATIESDEPLRGDGMAEAFRAALADAGCNFDEIDYRLADVSGEQYGFKEAALAIARTVRKVKSEFDIWHPADCIGEIGAAVAPCVLAVASAAARKRYAPGPGVLAHFGNDDGQRAAVVLRAGQQGTG
jgi:3-oxoacyl-[acyl-carrier-protein] synthase-1